MVKSFLVFLPCADCLEDSVEDEHNSSETEEIQRLVVVKQTDEVPDRNRNKAH